MKKIMIAVFCSALSLCAPLRAGQTASPIQGLYSKWEASPEAQSNSVDEWEKTRKVAKMLAVVAPVLLLEVLADRLIQDPSLIQKLWSKVMKTPQASA